MLVEESPRNSSSHEACLPFTYWRPIHYRAASVMCCRKIVKDWFLVSARYKKQHIFLSLKTDTGPLWWGWQYVLNISPLLRGSLSIVLPNLPCCFHKWDWVYFWCFCYSSSLSFFHNHYILLSHCTKTTNTQCLFLTCWENRLSCLCWDPGEPHVRFICYTVT